MTARPTDQGRARGLYDEQLQRQQQEKLFRFSTRVVVAEAVLIVSEPCEPGAVEVA